MLAHRPEADPTTTWPAAAPPEGPDERAVDRKMLVRQERPDLGLAKHCTQGLGRDRARQQPVAVLGEHGHVPHRVVDAETHEPAEQQVVVEPCLRLTRPVATVLCKPSAAAPSGPSRMPARAGRAAASPAGSRAARSARGAAGNPRRRCQRGIGHRQDRPQRVPRRHPTFAAQLAEQSPSARRSGPRIAHPTQLRRGGSNHGQATQTNALFPQPVSIRGASCRTEAAMPRGGKLAYTDEQKRRAEHIEES